MIHEFKKLKFIYEQLSNTNLKPNLIVNQLFTELVTIAKDTKFDFTKFDQIYNLQKLCAKGEYEMESYWSQKIIQSDNPQKEIINFPYFDNYQKLTNLEFNLLKSCTFHNKHRILFIGRPFQIGHLICKYCLDILG